MAITFDVVESVDIPLYAREPLKSRDFCDVRTRMILDHYKWDPQVGDVSTLASWPLVLRAAAWRQLRVWAERLAAEALAAERELLSRPCLWGKLGLPGSTRGALRRIDACSTPPSTPRIVRFDFHWSDEGWRLSEANSDVPGGFCEAGAFSSLVATHYPDLELAGDPGAAWADSIVATSGGRAVVALLGAAGYMEDHQIIQYIASLLRHRGLVTYLADPKQIAWADGIAHLQADYYRGPLDLIVRFYQGEWLPRLHRCFGPNPWRTFFQGSRTPITNPATTLMTECKRFPLVWDDLRTPLPAWRRLLPETQGVYQAPWWREKGWILKSAFSNNGDAVVVRELVSSKDWRGACANALLRPGQWLAQRQFNAVSISTPDGPRYPCIGVYTVNSKCAGIYGRVARKPLIDYAATDVAVLIEREI